ncbi:MAG: MFS transporter [Candidatus Parcubacteria bacterium]|nr:MFS transporter [Candidatus Parcubacteria bacterium]
METNTPPTQEKPKRGNVFYIGLISFFGGISQDMFVPILPLYLTNVLGLDKVIIGISEGLVTSGASLFKVVAGFLSDKFGKRKPFVFLGYFFSFVARPLLAFVSASSAILGLRFLDGIGKGLKDSPKDALIADSTVKATRGKEFGIARMLDTFGSVVGPIVLFGLMYLLRDHPSKYHIVLVLTTVPLFFTFLILKFKVKETPVAPKTVDTVLKVSLPRRFYIFLGIMILFSIGNSSDAFLILRSQDLGVALFAIPLVYALFNFVYASASIPLGSLSDKIGRERVIVLGWLAFSLSYFGFALAHESYQAWLLFAFYGLYYATTEGVAKAFVADMVPSDHRGRAYGIYNTAVGLVALPASFLAGLLWDKFGSSAPFFFGGTVSLCSVALLFFFSRKLPQYTQDYPVYTG